MTDDRRYRHDDDHYYYSCCYYFHVVVQLANVLADRAFANGRLGIGSVVADISCCILI